MFSLYSGPLVALGVLVAVACLAGSWHINRLQADLAKAVRHDAAAMEAALDFQVQLRHLRVHSIVLVSDPTHVRRKVVRDDLAHVDTALEAAQRTAIAPEDSRLVERIVQDYGRYRNNLALDQLPPSSVPMSEVARWSDAHHMHDLLAPCQELADRQREQMKHSLARSEAQTIWAGRVLFCLGFVGVLAGLLSGFVTAWALTRRVTKLSIRVQAAQAQLDQEVGAMTVQRTPQIGDLDEQLDQVVERVSSVCRRLQEQERDLLWARQLAAVGQLAAGVAHEIRNPLTGVKFLLQAAVRAQNPTPLTVDRLQLLLQEVARIERTVQGLMDFAQTPPPDRHLHDIRAVVEAAVNVTQSRAEVKAVTVRMDSSPEPLRATIDRDQLLSLLTNLLFNAIDATPAGGEVAVSIAGSPGSMIQVVVTDSGPGIDPALAGRLFTPFATTKPTGTGLGLTIARRVAREHGGELTAADQPGGGACFTLTLPSAEKPHAEAAGR
ncbi:MAG TPA: ATP-binding protein [Gemmataceae bacterium]|nr:ATP-binding protein [Gemmataceae bacterium]